MRAEPHAFDVREIAWTSAVLLGLSCLTYGLFWWLDFGALGSDWAPWVLLNQPGNQQSLTGMGEITVAVLGIAITVVAIILELAANRYTPRITELFIRNPVNVALLGFYVITSVLVLWVAMSLDAPTHPVWLSAGAVGMMTASLLSLLPYFAFVFDFVTPVSIISRITRRGQVGMKRVATVGERAIETARWEVVSSVEHLGEMAVNAVDGLDKTIAIAALDGLADLARDEMTFKERYAKAWFDTEPLVSADPDFIALHPDMVRSLTNRQTWVSMKILRQFEAIFREGLGRMLDVEHLVAIRTRQLAVHAASLDLHHDVELCLRFLNTYMRAAINARDVRTVYNLLNEYRLLASELIACGWEAQGMVVAHRMKEYGQIAFHRNLPFILETAAYDLCALLEHVHGRGAGCHDALLTVVMDVDREPEGDRTQEVSLRGVRKAQVKLATYYLAMGEPQHIQVILEELRDEKPARLASIQKELASVQSPEFWEVSDRGINFDYLTPVRREQLTEFFRLVNQPEQLF